jgi:hypothetical protein
VVVEVAMADRVAGNAAMPAITRGPSNTSITTDTTEATGSLVTLEALVPSVPIGTTITTGAPVAALAWLALGALTTGDTLNALRTTGTATSGNTGATLGSTVPGGSRGADGGGHVHVNYRLGAVLESTKAINRLLEPSDGGDDSLDHVLLLLDVVRDLVVVVRIGGFKARVVGLKGRFPRVLCVIPNHAACAPKVGRVVWMTPLDHLPILDYPKFVVQEGGLVEAFGIGV